MFVIFSIHCVVDEPNRRCHHSVMPDVPFDFDFAFRLSRFILAVHDDVNRQTAIHVITRLDFGQYVPNEIVIVNEYAFHACCD